MDRGEEAPVAGAESQGSPLDTCPALAALFPPAVVSLSISGQPLVEKT